MLEIDEEALEERIFGEDQDGFVHEDEEYDDLFKKWRKKRARRRAKKPRVRRRRRRRDIRRIARGKKPRHPSLVRDKIVPKRKPVSPIRKIAKKLTGAPVIKARDVIQHNRVNKAIQQEQQTKQAELKTIGLKTKVEQEKLNNVKLKKDMQTASMGKYAMILLGLVGANMLYQHFKGKKSVVQPVPKPA